MLGMSAHVKGLGRPHPLYAGSGGMPQDITHSLMWACRAAFRWKKHMHLLRALPVRTCPIHLVSEAHEEAHAFLHATSPSESGFQSLNLEPAEHICPWQPSDPSRERRLTLRASQLYVALIKGLPGLPLAARTCGAAAPLS